MPEAQARPGDDRDRVGEFQVLIGDFGGLRSKLSMRPRVGLAGIPTPVDAASDMCRQPGPGTRFHIVLEEAQTARARIQLDLEAARDLSRSGNIGDGPLDTSRDFGPSIARGSRNEAAPGRQSRLQRDSDEGGGRGVVGD